MKRFSSGSMSDSESVLQKDLKQRRKSVLDDINNSFEEERKELLEKEDNLLNTINSHDFKICVELPNNSRIYIQTKSGWTVKDLIKATIVHDDFRSMYYKQEWILDSINFLHHFDLELIMFRNIKPERERIIDFDNSIDELFELGFLNSSKTPFFALKDNRNTSTINVANNAELIEYKELIFAYSTKLPRANSLYYLHHFPELEDFFQLNKQPINSLNKLSFNPLITENKNWMIYDDESLGFLMQMDNTKMNVDEDSIKYDIKGEIYIQDTLPYVLLSTRDFKSFLINVTINKEQSFKLACNLHMTLRDILITLNKKLSKIILTNSRKSIMDLDVYKKILKAKMYNDYIIDLDRPLGRYVHIHENVKNGDICEYYLIDKPLFLGEHDNIENEEDQAKIKMFHRSSTTMNKDKVSLLKRTTLKFNEDDYDALKNSIKNFNRRNSNNMLCNVNNLASYTNNSSKIKQLTNFFSKNKIAATTSTTSNTKTDNTFDLKSNFSNLTNNSSNGNKTLLNNPEFKKEVLDLNTKLDSNYLVSYINFIEDKIYSLLKDKKIKQDNDNLKIEKNKIMGISNITSIKDRIQQFTKKESVIVEKPKEIFVDKINTKHKESIIDIKSTTEMFEKKGIVEAMKKRLQPQNVISKTNNLDALKIEDKNKEKQNYKKSITKSYLPLNTIQSKPNELETPFDMSSKIQIHFPTNAINNHLMTTVSNKSNGNDVEINPAHILEKLKKNIVEYDYYQYKDNFPLSERINSMYMNIYNSPIHLLSLTFPFTFKLISLIKIDKPIVIHNIFEKTKKFDLIFSMKVMIGKESLSKEVKLSFSNISRKDIENMGFKQYFNKNVYFKGLNFSELPLFSSLLFKVILIESTKSKSKDVPSTVLAWSNFKIFDHKNCLKSGKYKLNLHNDDFGDFSYFNWSDNPDSNSVQASSFEVFINIPSFVRTVEFPSTQGNSIYINNNKSVGISNELDLNNFMISESDSIIIQKIKKLNPFEEMTSIDKSVMWNNRYAAASYPELIPRLLEAMDFKQHEQLVELKKVLDNANMMEPIEALQLLTGTFLHEEVRSYAVKCLRQFDHYKLSEFIIQLVQALKYEPHHFSHLVECLIDYAVKYPATFGHMFFWCLRSEMYNPNIRQRYGLILEVFLSKVGKRFYKYLESEVWLVNKLLSIADVPFDKQYKDKSKKEEMIKAYRLALSDLNNEFNGKCIPLPTNFKLSIKSIVADKCKVMKSKKRPLWIAFKINDIFESEIENIMFKKGDDLRQDILTLQIFKIMRTMWFEKGLNLKMSIYPVVATGYFQGMLGMVKNSETLCTIHKIYGGATAAFSKEPLTKWLNANVTFGEKEYIHNFKLSCAAYCIATFVLGIGDRHNDNIMVKNNGELFHIDFGHFLGHFKYKYGIKRERAPFIFTREFKKVLGGKKTQE